MTVDEVIKLLRVEKGSVKVQTFPEEGKLNMCIAEFVPDPDNDFKLKNTNTCEISYNFLGKNREVKEIDISNENGIFIFV